MSGYTCRETYCSYGSYLRSRGYDKAICNLFLDLEAGKIKVGPIVPDGECSVTINGDVTVQGCIDPAKGTGIMSLYGGTKGTFLNHAAYEHFGLQAYTGAHVVGPIVQTGGGHAAATAQNPAGSWNAIANSTSFLGNVIIHGNLEVDGSFNELSNEVTETLTVECRSRNRRTASIAALSMK